MGTRLTAAEQAEFREARHEGLTAMTDLRTEMSALRIEVSKLAVTMAALPTRTDFNAELDKRVDRTSYDIAHRALEADVRDLASDFHEFKRRAAGASQRALPWVALGISTLLGITSTLISAAAVVATIILNHH
jgi:hypothetical protein